MKIMVHGQSRESWSSLPSMKTRVSCDDVTMVVDADTLPKKLVQLIPPRATCLAPEEWRPFCSLARNLGIM